MAKKAGRKRRDDGSDKYEPDLKGRRRSVQVPDELWELVTQAAKEKDMSDAAVIRHIITAQLVFADMIETLFDELTRYGAQCERLLHQLQFYVKDEPNVTHVRSFLMDINHINERLPILRRHLEILRQDAQLKNRSKDAQKYHLLMVLGQLAIRGKPGHKGLIDSTISIEPK